MDGKYTRLKLKMLLLVVLGTLIAGGVGIFLLEVVVDGVLQDPFARFFLWAATTLFGQSPEGAAELYQRYIRNNKQEILTLGTMLLMLIAFYLAMGRFTRWLDDIRSATRRLVEAQAEPVELPRELAPIQEDLNAIQRQLRAREAAARESEQRKGDLVAFLAHDLKTPLTSVVGYLTLLRDDPGLDAAQRAKFTGIALDKARRLEELLGEFFDITRMDLDSGPGERQPIQLSMLLEQLADEFYPLFAEKQLRCTVEIQHHLVVLGDPDKLAREKRLQARRRKRWIIHCFTHWKALYLCRSRNQPLRYMTIFVRNSLLRGCLPTRSLLSMKPTPKCGKRSCSLKSVPVRCVCLWAAPPRWAQAPMCRIVWWHFMTWTVRGDRETLPRERGVSSARAIATLWFMCTVMSPRGLLMPICGRRWRISRNSSARS